MPPTDILEQQQSRQNGEQHHHRQRRHHHENEEPKVSVEQNPETSKATPSGYAFPSNQMQGLTRWEDRKARKRQEKLQKYNKPQRTFVPAKPTRPLHNIVHFFRKGATVIVHIINITGRWMSTDKLFNMMLPYEELGLIRCSMTEDELSRSRQASDAGNEVHDSEQNNETSQAVPQDDIEQVNHSSSSPRPANSTCQQEQEAEPDFDCGITEEQIAAIEAAAISRGSGVAVNQVQYEVQSISQEEFAQVTSGDNNLQSTYMNNSSFTAGNCAIGYTTISNLDGLDTNSNDGYSTGLGTGSNASSSTISNNTGVSTYNTTYDLTNGRYEDGLLFNSNAYNLTPNGVKINEAHPHFIILDSRRPDEFDESHIHGVLIQHELAGIMLVPEAKFSRKERKQQKREVKARRKEERRRQRQQGKQDAKGGGSQQDQSSVDSQGQILSNNDQGQKITGNEQDQIQSASHVV